MQAPPDPSHLVHMQLLPHMHLISTYQYPHVPRLQLDQALGHLLQAPQIFREVRPVAWTYLAPPPDGTTFLAWQAPRMGNGFASDGYIWIDQEMTYRQQMRGYIVEILVHRAGYVFQHEQIATHQRMRFHIIDKDPSLPPVDPAFWLVHYGQADPEYRRPANQIPIPQQVQKIMQERVFLEQQGAVLQRKEFMLLDRSNWPQVNTNMGVRPQPGNIYATPSRGGPVAPHTSTAYNQTAQQLPNAKRLKTSISQPPGIIKNEISDVIFEEDTEFGDYFDTLTPAEISKMRYKQHHEWMEEIFSSVYPLSQIIPEDLGFGLTGSLKELTDGIFTAPDPQTVLAPFDPNKDKAEPNLESPDAKAARPSHAYQKLSAEKVEDFEKRIQQFVEKGQADIRAMKAQHAETVAQFNKSKTYMKAERKLREINGNGDAEDVVNEVENALGARVMQHKSKICIEEGGLEKEDKSRLQQPAPQQNAESASSSNGFTGNGNGNENSFFETGDNSAANLLDEFGGGSYTNSPAARIGTPGISQPQSGMPTPGATVGTTGNDFMQSGADAAGDPTEEGGDDTGLDLLEGMDMDVDMTGLGEGGSESAKPGAEDDWVMVNDNAQQSSTQPSNNGTPAAPTSNKPTPPDPIAQPTNAALSTDPPTISASAMVEAPTSTNTPNEAGGMFDSAEFGDTFDGLDTAGDALADFETGEDDLGLDLGGAEFDGAFGDTPGGSNGGGS